MKELWAIKKSRVGYLADPFGNRYVRDIRYARWWVDWETAKVVAYSSEQVVNVDDERAHPAKRRAA